MIEIGGKKYKVVENLGFQAGYQAKIVYDPEYDEMERVAVKRGGKWTWWTVKDKLGGIQ